MKRVIGRFEIHRCPSTKCLVRLKLLIFMEFGGGSVRLSHPDLTSGRYVQNSY